MEIDFILIIDKTIMEYAQCLMTKQPEDLLVISHITDVTLQYT